MRLRNIPIVIAVLIAAGVIGIAILKYAVGILVFIIFGSGSLLGFMIAKLIYHKKEN
jgi:hypothetical protein